MLALSLRGNDATIGCLAMCLAVRSVPTWFGAVLASTLALAFALPGCGHIGWVDAIDVEPYGTVFDVLPGCHVVTLRRKVGASDVSGAWVAELGTMTYVFWMKPGHLYSIDVSVRFRSASHGSMTITAAERDSSGAVLNVVPQARAMREIEACRDWQAAATLPAPDRPAPTPTPTVPMPP